MVQQPKKSDSRKAANRSELFDGFVNEKVESEDLFAGRVLSGETEDYSKKASTQNRFAKKRQADKTDTKSYHYFWIFLLLSINLLLMGGVLGFIILKKTPPVISAAPVIQEVMRQTQTAENPPQTASIQPVHSSAEQNKTEQEGELDPSVLLKTITFSRSTSEVLEKAASLESAESLYRDGDYFNACYMYDQLRKNMFSHTPEQQSLRDYLYLKMALCLQKIQEQELLAGLFTKTLQSPFPVIRAMSNYNLAYIEMHNHNYMAARSHAFRTLAMLKLFQSQTPERMEADCYFLAAESLTRHILNLTNKTEDLPGSSWSDSSPIWNIPFTQQTELQNTLLLGFDEISKAALVPVVTRDPQRRSGVQWNVICRDAPLEEILWKYSSVARVNLEWSNVDNLMRSRAISLYLPYSSGTYVTEVAAGSAGLLYRFDGEKARLYDPGQYTDFNSHKSILVREAISVWQRFLLKFRGDDRTPNAHYLLGVLYALENQQATALGEYKILTSQHSANTLTPFALLNSSIIKTNLLDFNGARADLQELLIQYPDCKVTDEASLYLAEAAAGSGDFAQAEKMFHKVFQLNLTQDIQNRAAYGLGNCAYEQKNFQKAAEWLTKAIQLTSNPKDSRISPACYKIGKCFIQMGEFEKASNSLRVALGGELDTEEYVEIVLELVRSEMKQERYIQAMQIIEGIPERTLNQEQSCDVLLAKARILQEIDLVESAVSMLRRRIEYIAEASLRARLTLELAYCYNLVGDYRIAEKELIDTVYDLDTDQEQQRGFALMAEAVYMQDKIDKAREICIATLREYPQDTIYKQQVASLLGRIYEDRKQYNKAALAYAGLLPAAEDGRP